MRIRGVRPYNPGSRSEPVIIEPGGRFFQKDARLGYRHLPGKFKVALNDGHSFTATHLESTLRITNHPDYYKAGIVKPQIWIFGCSFVHGWGLNDNETFPWLLQEKLPDYEVVNFGVSGYGTIQSLIQLKDALDSGRKPAWVIIVYASFHDARNSFLRERRKLVAMWTSKDPGMQPYAKIDRQGNLRHCMGSTKYNEFPLMRYSSLMHYIEQRYDAWEARLYRSHEVSKAIMEEIDALCRKNRVRLLVAGILSDSATRDMLKFCQGQAMMTADISVDFNDPENLNLPFDRHPGALANMKFAQSLYLFLKAHATGEERTHD